MNALPILCFIYWRPSSSHQCLKIEQFAIGEYRLTCGKWPQVANWAEISLPLISVLLMILHVGFPDVASTPSLWTHTASSRCLASETEESLALPTKSNAIKLIEVHRGK